MITEKNINKFFNNFIPEPNTGCWLWTEASHYKGYGEIYVGPKKEKAHRFSWKIHNGEILNNLWVLHKCDTPACVNPDHLFLGNNSDNQKDAAKKGRHNKSKKKFCIKGHPYLENNIQFHKDGYRRCIECRKIESAKYRIKTMGGVS